MDTKTETIANFGIITSLVLQPQIFPSLEEMASLSEMKLSPGLEKNIALQKAVNAPIVNGEEDFYLFYYPQKFSIPSGKEFYDFLSPMGLRVTKKAYPSFLVDAMTKLTEVKLKSMGIPDDVNIILPTSESSTFADHSGNACFFGMIRRFGTLRHYYLEITQGDWNALEFAFLLQKI